MAQPNFIGRSISLLSRRTRRYFDLVLAPYQIGCGQQLFLLIVYQKPGISMYDLAKTAQFDKGTATRAAQKLEEAGYLRIETDPRDKRVRRLYATEAARAVADSIYAARQRWERVLAEGLTPEEAAAAARLLEKLAQNAENSINQEEQAFGANTKPTDGEH